MPISKTHTPLPGSISILLRDQAILARRLKGEKLEAIGLDFGISRERVRQIQNATIREMPDASQVIEQLALARSTSQRQQQKNRWALQRELRAAIQTGFDRERLLQLIGFAECPLDDIALCGLLHDQFGICRFYSYLRCHACESVKPMEDFPPYAATKLVPCRACGTVRTRYYLNTNPAQLKRIRLKQLARPNYQRLVNLRCALKRAGRASEIPPLPPRGTPESEIVVPPLPRSKPLPYCLDPHPPPAPTPQKQTPGF